MRLVVIALCFLSIGAKAQIPFEKVVTAKIFMYNITDKKTRPDFKIFADGNYAPSALPVAKDVSNDDIKKLEKLVSKGLAELRMGLSGCFIPRHGIVFYDAGAKPIGSISLCFQCESLRLWPADEYKRKKKVNEKKALAQLEEFKAICERSGWKVYDSPATYLKELQ